MSEVKIDHGRKLPLCLRKYDRGNPECDGKPRARTPEERIPCVYRDRCVALQRLVRVKGYKARELLKLRKVRDPDGKRRVYAFAVGDSEEFQQRLVRVIDRYGIRNGRITIQHPSEEVPRRPRRALVERSEEAKKKSIAALVKARKFSAIAWREKTRKDLNATRLLLQWFLARLQRASKCELALDQGSAEPGQFFTIDRVSSSRYVTLYAKVYDRNRRRKTRRPIACIVFGVRTHSMQFRFPFDRATLESLLPKQARRKVQPATFIEGRFLSRTCQVEKEGASLVAEVIARAIDKGIIRMPKAGAP